MKVDGRSRAAAKKLTRLPRREFLKNMAGLSATGMAATAAGQSSGKPSCHSAGGSPAYKRADAPIEERIRDLLGRMNIAEKARQLDMYRGSGYVDKLRDHTHCAPDAHFEVSKAMKDWGTLGVGSIHDLYPTPRLANEIQAWIMERSRLQIPAIFIEEGLHGYAGYGKTIFPQSINVATTWNRDVACRTGAAIAAEARADGVHMILGPVCGPSASLWQPQKSPPTFPGRRRPRTHCPAVKGVGAFCRRGACPRDDSSHGKSHRFESRIVRHANSFRIIEFLPSAFPPQH